MPRLPEQNYVSEPCTGLNASQPAFPEYLVTEPADSTGQRTRHLVDQRRGGTNLLTSAAALGLAFSYRPQFRLPKGRDDSLPLGLTSTLPRGPGRPSGRVCQWSVC
jgi:hypothetical protein